MRTLTKLEDFSNESKPLVLAAGAFDGVHRGHQAVLAHALENARARHGEAWALTFDPHPLKILRPEAAPALLTSTPHKLHLIEKAGMHGCLVMSFTPELAHVEPEKFIEQLRIALPSLAEMIVGENWTFGHRARGNVRLLRDLAEKNSFQATVLGGLVWKGQPISSTRIRLAVTSGHLADAAEMLGRPFSIWGTVVPGRKIGRQLGFRTANLDPHNEVRPPPGIYAVKALVRGATYPAAAYLSGQNDAAEPARGMVEVHLIDQQMDLYDEDIEIFFVRKLRDDQVFTSNDELKAQIARDIDLARTVSSS